MAEVDVIGTIAIPGSVQIRHAKYRLSLTINSLLESSSSSPGAACVPQVADKEEEGEHKRGCTHPLAEVHEVHRVGLGDDPANGIK